jgi:hypothetical protein
MANKSKKNGDPRRKQRILISAVAIFLVIISVLAYASSLHQTANPPPQPGKRASSEYFLISSVAGTYKSYFGKNSSDPNPGPSVRITTFGFQFTPIGGPATDVALFVPGMTDTTKYWWAGITIPNGTKTYSGDIQPPNSLLALRQDDGTYQLTIRINSLQADGDVVLTFTAGKNLYGISA